MKMAGKLQTCGMPGVDLTWEITPIPGRNAPDFGCDHGMEAVNLGLISFQSPVALTLSPNFKLTRSSNEGVRCPLRPTIYNRLARLELGWTILSSLSPKERI